MNRKQCLEDSWIDITGYAGCGCEISTGEDLD